MSRLFIQLSKALSMANCHFGSLQALQICIRCVVSSTYISVTDCTYTSRVTLSAKRKSKVQAQVCLHLLTVSLGPLMAFQTNARLQLFKLCQRGFWHEQPAVALGGLATVLLPQLPKLWPTLTCTTTIIKMPASASLCAQTMALRVSRFIAEDMREQQNGEPTSHA